MAGGSYRLEVIEATASAIRSGRCPPGLFRDYLMEHRIATGEPPVDALVFGQKSGKPFQAATIYRRADRA